MEFDNENTRDEWHQCMNIMIAYHMARIYKEDIATAVKRACMAVSLKTKSKIIYNFCMDVIHQPSGNAIIEAMRRLEQEWDHGCII